MAHSNGENKNNVHRLDLGRPQKPWGFYPSQITEQPGPPQWIVDGLFMRGTVAVVAGGKAVGKSLLVQQMFSAAALGLPFLGRHTEPTRAFAYFCEDAQDRLVARQFDICASLDIELLALKDFFSWEERATEECLLVKYPTNGTKPEYTADWYRLWDYVESEGVQLVALDTARAIFAGNENNPAQVTPFIRALQAKAIQMDGAIILNCHPSKGGSGPSGTGAWHNSARAGWNFQLPAGHNDLVDPPTNARVLYDIGSNYTGRSSISFYWEAGVFQPADDPSPPRRTDCPISRDLMDRDMLDGLYKTRSNGGRVPADWDRQGSLQRRFRTTFDRNTAWNDLNASVERLLARNQIVRVKVAGECLLRPVNHIPYPDEEKWLI